MEADDFRVVPFTDPDEVGIVIFTSAEFAGIDIDAAAGVVRVAFARRTPVQRRLT